MSSNGYLDYYKVLGVERNANTQSIKKAYRLLARKFHPDVNPGDANAESQFKKISEAYEVLSDPEKRKRYEQYGQYWDNSRGQSNPGFEVDFGNYGNFDDFINDLLGRMGRPRGASGFPRDANAYSNTPSKNLSLDAEVVVKISFSEAFHGTERTLSVNEERVQVKIPQGVKAGSKLRLKDKGNFQPGTGKRGDLYLILEIIPHSIWRLEGNQLIADLPLSLDEFLLGATITTITPDGEAQLNIPPGTSPDTNLRLKGKGWPFKKSRGDLIFTIKLCFPSEWSPEELKCLEELKRIRKINPRESWLQSARL